ncbi:She9p [Kluyveromyces lactis]|uniref:Sensitive to high expression protein 9 homolog, mitochondrial n=1 Tax=Kluyveromyces lactis (strain ATCC 8585 / CBS 2359 / DSM 70799 / NBRC 1267 / NRRL Y-1140 / WM37) TaxID=284590 RepID=SHE9_KLULA|nr:uncharacterized protein KLLA0_C06512g [Kluyveromyces lactis]Q6CUA2.1 RecName: Full=Sensitive to high expression protein 9 homolog, mitochondrial; Flags: Precursor [Kluyveromyces lactis NRRL Y-1140]CAH01338.1 KLLA0C06512p [Kluyveromyces lactis]|eukprot:XP_452487.1 uncharacterized protein KLLA0_C06512g [Kluyveromyces lactis]
MLVRRIIVRLPSSPRVWTQYNPRIFYSTGPNTNSTLVDTWKQKLGAYWEKSQNKANETANKLREYSVNFKTQWDKAQKSLKDANERLSQMENDSNDSKLNYNAEGKIKDLPSERERHRKKWARKMELYLDSLQETIFTATRALNDVTGYSSIQKLRNTISSLEEELKDTKKLVNEAKEKYETAIKARSGSQKEVNELLQRKNSWSPTDLDRFTQLYRDDALNSQTEEQSKVKLAELEAKEEELSTNLYRAILTRYHEEQIWSDKIRRTSTWGTFILMGVNILFFVIFQLLLEPWKRRRLVGSFEDKVKMALDDHQKEQNLAISEMSNTIDNLMDKKLQETQTKPHQEEVPKILTFSNIVADFKIWCSLQWTIYYNKLVTLLPETTVTFTKSCFYSYSTLLLSLGILLGHCI